MNEISPDHLPPRVLPTEGIHNFRDYGGYVTNDGGRVKRGLLFRSGQHQEATSEDLDAVAALNLAHVIDLRGNSERHRHPCARPAAFSAEVHFFDGETAGLSLAPHLEAAEKSLDEASAHAAMTDLYAQLPFRENLIWILRRYFAALAEGQGASLVHCLAGKDRTGMAVALLHHALGVHPDDAMEDFLLTNNVPNNEARIAAGYDAVKAKYRAANEGVVRILMGVDPRYLEAARAALREHHGGEDGFLREVLGVDDTQREALRLHLVDA